MLEWNVIYGNFNSGRIETLNIFNHYRFYEDCVKNAKKNRDNKEAFAERLKLDLEYYYRSKCEWEVIVSHWPPVERFHDEKIDVYDQITMNWDVFLDYVWEHRSELYAKSK